MFSYLVLTRGKKSSTKGTTLGFRSNHPASASVLFEVPSRFLNPLILSLSLVGLEFIGLRLSFLNDVREIISIIATSKASGLGILVCIGVNFFGAYLISKNQARN